MRLALLAAAAVVLILSGARADDPKGDTDRARLVRFLKDHVVGRTVATPTTTFKLHDNTMEGEYADRTSYGNLTETATGFTFDATSVSTETRYELDKTGKRVGPGKEVYSSAGARERGVGSGIGVIVVSPWQRYSFLIP